MSTQDERSQIAVLQNDMQQVKSDISDIKTRQVAGFGSIEQKLDIFATKQELKIFKWITIPLIIVLTAVLTGLVAFYFSHQSPTANNPTTSSTTTVNTPGGSTSTTSTKDGTPAATASATSHSDTATPDSSQTSQSNPAGGVTVTLPKGL